MPSDPLSSPSPGPDPVNTPAPLLPPGRSRWGRPASLGRLLVAGVVVAFFPALWLINARTPRPRNLGVFDGLLLACPDSPNCVNSQSRDDVHGLPPIQFEGTTADAMTRLRAIVTAQPRTLLLKETEDYLRYEFRTRLCFFVDDVEFHVDDIARVIHVRSASRIGYSDLGTNRRRVERIRDEFAKPRDASPTAGR